MTGYIENIERLTLENDAYRQVLYTTHEMQLVLMALAPGEEIGAEIHEHITQFIRIEEGQGRAVLGEDATLRDEVLTDGSVVIIPAGTRHNIINTSDTEHLRLYTLYAPPEHRRDVYHDTKATAEADTTDHFDGVVSEGV